MINGKAQDFVNHIYYGDELWFEYNHKKYFLEGWSDNDTLDLVLFEMVEHGKEFRWKGDTKHYPVESFLSASIFDGKTFWEVEKNIVWLDC